MMQIQSRKKKSHTETANEDVDKYIKYALVQTSFNIIKNKLTFHYPNTY